MLRDDIMVTYGAAMERFFGRGYTDPGNSVIGEMPA
jgi:hypothetical protein